jgi:hypothetical protein
LAKKNEKEIIMSDPRAPHDPRDPRAPNDPLTTGGTNTPQRSGNPSGMPTWGWAAIAGVVLLLAVLFMWPTGTTDQADLGTPPTAAPPVTAPASPPPADEPAPPQAAPPQAPPAQSPPAQ